MVLEQVREVPAGRARLRRDRREGRMHPVHDQRGGLDTGVPEAGREVRGLLDRVGSRRGDEHVRGPRVGQEVPDGRGPRREALLHALEGLEEVDGVLDDLGPGDPRDRPQQGLGRDGEELQRGASGCEQRAEQTVVEEPGEPARRVEEVQCVAGGWRVHHDEVEVPALGQLVELLHRHVLLGARQHPGQVLVDPVGSDRLGLGLAARVALDEVVEGALGVEHHGVERAREAALDRRRRVGERPHAQRVGEPPGRVDSDDARPAARAAPPRGRWRPRSSSCPPRPVRHTRSPIGRARGRRPTRTARRSPPPRLLVEPGHAVSER